MKKFTILSLATVALMFTACGDKEKTTEATVEAPVAVEATAPVVAEVTAPAAGSDDAGKTAFAACAACHGADGKLAALGKSAIIAGQSSADLLTKMKGYKAGTIDLTGNGMLMKGQMANLDDAKIEALATYISKL